jgi:molybdopterin-guanine dinucleotide biosynthesis protein B
MTQIISVVGKSQSGKTTFIEKLIPELKGRGYRVGTIKHAFHGFKIDWQGKDSWRHKQAGADTVMMAGPGQFALVKDETADTLDEYEKYFEDVDIVITEGFKKGNKPKIEILRAARHTEPLCSNDDRLFALVTDTDVELGVPKFGLDAAADVADLIERRFIL